LTKHDTMKNLFLLLGSVLLLNACGTPLAHQRTHKWNGRVEASASKKSMPAQAEVNAENTVSHDLNTHHSDELTQVEVPSERKSVNTLSTPALLGMASGWSQFKDDFSPKLRPKRSAFNGYNSDSSEEAQLSLDRDLVIIIILFAIAILLSLLTGLLVSGGLAVFWILQVAASIIALIALILLIIYLLKLL